MLEVKVINSSGHELPVYETNGAAGLDLKAHLEADVVLKPLQRSLIKTGLFLEIPVNFEAQVRPRSGLALKQGITVLNTPGTIDSDYRGEVGVILINLSDIPVTIKNGDRIAQLVFAKHEQATWLKVTELGSSKRGASGFGSTGKE